jgi:hypothetical protein
MVIGTHAAIKSFLRINTGDMMMSRRVLFQTLTILM